MNIGNEKALVPRRNRRKKGFESLSEGCHRRTHFCPLLILFALMAHAPVAWCVGGTAHADSADFTLDTIGIPGGVGGTAQSDSLDFTLNTTDESPGVYADSADFTLDTRDAAPATLSGPAYLSGNQFQFSVSGTTGVTYVVEANTNLNTSNWVALFTNSSPFTFTDSSASNYVQRFYRAVYFP